MSDIDYDALPWRKVADDVPITRADAALIPTVFRALAAGALNDEVALAATGEADPAEGRAWRDTFRSLGIIREDANVATDFMKLTDLDDSEIIEAFAHGFNYLPEVRMTREDRTAEWVQAGIVVKEDMHTAVEEAKSIVARYDLTPPDVDDEHAWERDTRFMSSLDTPGGRTENETSCPWCYITVPKAIIGDYSVCDLCESGIHPIGSSTREAVFI